MDGLARRTAVFGVFQRRQRVAAAGELMLVVGEMDKNVDPSSTYQVVDRLIKANKQFDLLVIPGGGHRLGGRYGQLKLMDFMVRHLKGETAQDWNRVPPS